MAKQRKTPTGIQEQTAEIGTRELHAQADALLRSIAYFESTIAEIEAEYRCQVVDIHAAYVARIAPSKTLRAENEEDLLRLMKSSQNPLFTDADVVNLPHGSLIHAIIDKVRIPKTALAACEELGFHEVVKIAKSLDREAVEKWPDEKLILIGAERKEKEEFSYDLKKDWE